MSTATTTATTATTARKWSAYQEAYFSELLIGNGNIVLEALAGCGKSTTIVEGCKHIPSSAKTLFMTFSKTSQTDLESKVRAGIDVKTFHSFGLQQIKNAFGYKIEINVDKVKLLFQEYFGKDIETYQDLFPAIKKTISLAKAMLIPFKDDKALEGIIEEYDISFPDNKIDDKGNEINWEDIFKKTVWDLLADCANMKTCIDFDDMIWLPLIHQVRISQYDYVILDECQDTNKSQLELSLRACKNRFIAVGDRNQAIYHFRGAGNDSMGNIISQLSPTVLPLPRTYRCGKAIVKLAQTIVPEYEFGENNPEGEVIEGNKDLMFSKVVKGDMIISRSNAPLVGTAFSLIKLGKPAIIAGKDEIGEKLISTVKKIKGKDIIDFIKRVENYRAMKIKKLLAKNKDASPDNINDECDCLLAFAENSISVNEVVANITKLYSDISKIGVSAAIVLSTTHKAKGLERDNIFILRDTYKPNKDQEETNLYYVAITRAIHKLYLISKK
jgi:superfamily I DNA/RNA helicase